MSDPRSDAQKQTDPLIASAYRDLATERVPDALDDIVLKKAHSAVAPRYSGSVRWLRPMAWAATIALSLAIVVQLADIPQVTPPTSDTSFAVDAKREQVTAAAPAAALQSGTISEQEQSAGGALPAPALREQKERQQNTLRKSADQQAFKVSEAPILEDAAQIARLQKGPGIQDNLPLTPAHSVPPASAADQETLFQSGCDAQTRKQAEGWHACIVELEKAGLSDLAEHERRQLEAAFPDYEWPTERD